MAVCIACAVSLPGAVVASRWIAKLAANSGRGLDSSDEAIYILSVEYPHAAPASATGFDTYLSLIWRLCGSIARYRLAGLLLLLGAVFVTARLSIGAVAATRHWATVVAVSLILAPIVLTVYGLWTPTPGYNLLVVVVTLLVAAMTAQVVLVGEALSLTPADGRDPPHTIAWLGFALSVGLVIKGPAFLVVGALSATAILITLGRDSLAQRWRSVAVGFGGGVLLFIALTGLPLGIARRFWRGIRATELLKAHTIETTLETEGMRHVYGPWFFRFVIGAAVLRLVWRWIRADEIRLAITAAGAVVTAVMFGRSLPVGGTDALSGPAGWWWIRLTALMLLWSTATARVVSRRLVVGPLLALMAIGAAAGSGNGVIHEVAMTAGLLGVGVLVHSIVLTRSRNDSEGHQSNLLLRQAVSLVPIVAFFLVGCLASNQVLSDALRNPYRLVGPLEAENEKVDLGRYGTLDVSPETARYVRDLQAIGAQMPADALDCLVDLAGGTPLSALALGAKPASVPWIVGGYPGSNDFAAYVLQDMGCLEGSYILIEAPGGKRAIARPPWLDTTGAVLLGRVAYRGYLDEVQLVWLVSRPQLGSSG